MLTEMRRLKKTVTRTEKKMYVPIVYCTYIKHVMSDTFRMVLHCYNCCYHSKHKSEQEAIDFT